MYQASAHSKVPLTNNDFTGRSCQYVKNVRRTAFFMQTLAVNMDNELSAASCLLFRVRGKEGKLDFVQNGQ